MSRNVLRLGGLVLLVVAVAIGAAIGRVIEAGAVGLVLFVIWGYLARQLVAPDREPAGRSDGSLE
jgi:hypothetical protein